jgi:hypothetical protein
MINRTNFPIIAVFPALTTTSKSSRKQNWNNTDNHKRTFLVEASTAVYVINSVADTYIYVNMCGQERVSIFPTLLMPCIDDIDLNLFTNRSRRELFHTKW